MAAVSDVFPFRLAGAHAIPWEKARLAVVPAILVAQALLTARLISPNYASGDEGRYIYAGHQLVYELWHGGGSPYYETYFSGSPVIYPVLAAMADHLGGLVAVRLMSLVFMLTATTMLFAVGRRLFGYSSGVLAAALFAGLGLTQDLGALATYDAMSLMLMTVAAYCAVRVRAGDLHATAWLLAIPIVLLVANCTKYVTVVFDPAVIILAALQGGGGWRRFSARCAALGIATGTALGLALILAGGAYLHGILFSTFARKAGTDAIFAIVKQPESTIALESWRWIGVTVVGSMAAFVGAVLFRKDKRAAAIVALFMLAGLLVTLEGLHLHTDESMRKHDDFSAWFACAGAGSVAAYVRFRVRYIARATTAVVVLAIAVVSGLHYSKLAGSTFEAGGSKVTLEVAATLRPYLQSAHYQYLLGGYGDDQILYLDHAPVRWYNNHDDLYLKYPVPGRGGDAHGQAAGRACFRVLPGCVYLEGITAYRAAIHAHWFALISMWGDHNIHQDAQIVQTVAHTSGYVLLTHVGNAPTWIYAPAYRHIHTTAGHPHMAPVHPGPAPASTRQTHGPAMATVLRAFVITLEPSGMFLAAGLLLVGGVTWQQRMRHGRQHMPAQGHTVVNDGQRASCPNPTAPRHGSGSAGTPAPPTN